MNIIEAIQYAEKGKLITNGFIKRNNSYLEYWKEGVFREHRIVEQGQTEFTCEHRHFSMASVLATDWELVHVLKLPLSK